MVDVSHASAGAEHGNGEWGTAVISYTDSLDGITPGVRRADCRTFGLQPDPLGRWKRDVAMAPRMPHPPGLAESHDAHWETRSSLALTRFCEPDRQNRALENGTLRRSAPLIAARGSRVFSTEAQSRFDPPERTSSSSACGGS
jgi:hypothetical protein